MEVKIKLSKYDILGAASMIGATQENMECIEKYLNEHDNMELDVHTEEDGFAQMRIGASCLVVMQISEELNLN